MNILFLAKFYDPFDRGGSEWSTHDLARLLVLRGHRVTILTPNYGAEPQEMKDGIMIKRFFFLKKLKKKKGEITPWWTNNIFWFLYTTLICTFYVIRGKFDVIHAHNNEFLPVAVIAGAFTKKTTVATFRDYQSICNFGFCLWQRRKACNFGDYLKDDFKFFWDNYVSNKNIVNYIFLYLAAVRSWVITRILFYCAGKVKHKVAVSKQLSLIFRANGISGMRIIHNPVIIRSLSKKKKAEIVFVGKFSKGKGVDLLMELIPSILEKYPSLKFKFVGSGVLDKYLRKKVKDNKLGNRVVFTGRVEHEAAVNFMKEASLVVVPSIWPEPLPRSVIEAILVGTPVAAAKVGGIKEIIKNNIYGILADPDKDSFKIAIETAFLKKDKLSANIAKDLKILRDHFSNKSVEKYLQIYKTI